MYFCSLRKVLSKYLIADKTVLTVKVEKKSIFKKILIRAWKIRKGIMSRQLNFYASDADRKIIADILCEHFGEMIEVPSHKDSLQLFEDTVDKRFYLLTDLDSKEHITYREHTYYDQREALVLDEYNSCIFYSFQKSHGSLCKWTFLHSYKS